MNHFDSTIPPVEIELTGVNNGTVNRRYVDVKSAGDFWQHLTDIISNPEHGEILIEAWKIVLPDVYSNLIEKTLKFRKKEEIEEKFSEPLPVDWYLAYITEEYLKKGKPRDLYSVKSNAFRDYRATELSHANSLLCPPFFESLRPDSNRPIRLSDCEENRKKENDLKEGRFIRGLQDSTLFLSRIIKHILDIPNPKELTEEEYKAFRRAKIVRLFSWFEMNLDLEIREVFEDRITLKLTCRDPADLIRCEPQDWHDLAEFGIEPKIWSISGSDKEILLTSPNVRACVGRLALAWHNVNLRKLLLIAPPGSGKERLKDLFLAARNVEDGCRRDFIATDLNKGMEELRKILGEKKFANSIDPRKEKYAIYPHEEEKDTKSGESAPSKWGQPTLFVDEIHQASASARASLLRILEEDKMQNEKGFMNLKLLVWLFAASDTRTDLLKLKPLDFWTRMDEIVEMQHPMDFRDSADEFGDSRIRVLADYFWMNWCIGGDETDGVREKILRALRKEKAFGIARKFAETVGSPLLPLFSVRYIRGIAKRIRSQAILLGLKEHPFDEDSFIDKICLSYVADWTTDAFEDIVLSQK